MNRISSVLFLVIGAILLGYGINANHSLASGVSRAFTGQPTDHTLFLIIGGAVLVVMGLGGLFSGQKS